MAGAGEQGMEIHRLRDFHAFLVKIDQAIQHQESEVIRAHVHWEAAHAKWLDQRRQVKAYEVLAERHRSEARRLEEKRDQRLTDEAASQKHHPLGDHSLI
jgi:flagellar FliJ protein